MAMTMQGKVSLPAVRTVSLAAFNAAHCLRDIGSSAISLKRTKIAFLPRAYAALIQSHLTRGTGESTRHKLSRQTASTLGAEFAMAFSSKRALSGIPAQLTAGS